MKCIENELIQKYIDHETSPGETSQIEKHVKECPECARKIVRRRNLSHNVMTVMNELNTEGQPIPSFFHPKVPSERKLLNRKWILYDVSAACLLIFMLILTRKSHPDNLSLLRTEARTEVEVDANRPVTEQPMLIQITDPEGNVTEYTLN